MALGTPVAGAFAYSAAGGTTVSPAYPAGIGAGDVLVLIVGQKPSAANSGSVTTPSGWTLQHELVGAGGYGATLGADTGNTNLRVYTKNTVSGSESGTLAVTLATNNVAWGSIVLVPAGAGTISYGSTSGSDTAGGVLSITGAADPGFIAGDMALCAACIPTDVTTPAQFSGHTISGAGALFPTVVELGEADSTTGNDIGGLIIYGLVSSGTSSGAPNFAATAAGTTTNVRGPGVMLRIREAAAASYVYKGALAWSGAYKGARSDAALYKGAKTLHP